MTRGDCLMSADELMRDGESLMSTDELMSGSELVGG